MPEIKQDLRTATMIVAADDSLHRNMANYVCDGVADDVEIQAALNAVAMPGIMGRVVLLDGTFNCAADILVPNRTTLEGQGFNSILNFAGAAIANAITLAGDDIHVKNLRAHLAAGAGAALTRPNIIYGNGRESVWLENLLIIGDESVADDGSDLRQCGILLENGGYSKVINCRVEDCMRHGIHINNVINTTVEGNTSTNHGQWGILLFNGSDWCNVVGNNCDLNGHGGINIATCYNCTVTGNDCDTNTLHGILIYDSQYCTVTGNTCVDNDAHGINIEHNSINNVISGNICVYNDHGDTASYDGINVNDNSIYNEIIGNQCSENARYGIGVESGPNSVLGNYAYHNDRHGIYVDAADCGVNDNYCYHNGADAAGTYHGIFLAAGADRCQVNDNVCSDDGTLQDDGVHLADGANEIQIVGNYCHSNIGSGIILVANNDNCLIKDNHCNSNTRYGVEIVAASCEDNVVENNKLIGNVMGAILDGGTRTGLPYIFVNAPNPSTNIGTHPAELLTDGLEVTSRLEVYLPMGFQEFVRAQVIIVPSGTGDLRRSVATNWGEICSGETYNADGGTIAAGQVAVTANHLECIDISAAFVGVGALGQGDLIGVEFTRGGDNALDTVNANCYLLGLRVQYV